MNIEIDDDLFKKRILDEARTYVNSRCFSIVEQELRREVMNQLHGEDLGQLIKRNVSDFINEKTDEEFEKQVSIRVNEIVKGIIDQMLNREFFKS